jgi:hypothetical protein
MKRLVSALVLSVFVLPTLVAAAQLRLFIKTTSGEQLSDSTGGIVYTIASPGSIRDQDGFNWTTCGVPSSYGAFTFCSPYGTLAYRLTDHLDCSDGVIDPDLEGTVDDCVRQAWYSNKMQMFYRGRQQDADPGTPVCSVVVLAYSGAFKVCVDFSQTPAVRTKARLFDTGDRLASVNSRTDNYMVSPSEANILYIVVDGEIRRCDAADANLPLDSENAADCELLLDIRNSTFRTLVDADAACGSTAAGLANSNVWSLYLAREPYVAGANRVLATFYISDPEDGVVCNAYIDDWDTANATTYFGPGDGDSNVTMSGRFGTWLTQAASCDVHPVANGAHGLDMHIRDFETDTTFVWCDQDGAPGHLTPTWHGVCAEDNWSDDGQDLRCYDFRTPLSEGTKPPSYHHDPEYGSGSFVQPNQAAQDPDDLPFNQQVGCTLTTTPEPDNAWTGERELRCGFYGATQWLVVAPSMALFGTVGCGGDEDFDYYCAPKPPLSSDGRWLFLCTNMGTDRMDCFYIRVPRANLPAASAPAPVIATNGSGGQHEIGTFGVRDGGDPARRVDGSGSGAGARGGLQARRGGAARAARPVQSGARVAAAAQGAGGSGNRRQRRAGTRPGHPADRGPDRDGLRQGTPGQGARSQDRQGHRQGRRQIAVRG